MKKIIVTILQFLLFLFVFAAGSLFPPFHIQHVLNSTPAATRIFIADGLILMVILYLVLILIEVLRKHIKSSALWITSAFVLAAVLGFALKFGFLTRSAF